MVGRDLTYGGGLTWSADGGASWAPRPQQFNQLHNYLPGGFLTLNGSGPVHLAATNIEVEKSVDGGATWLPSSIGLPMPASPTRLVRNADASEIYLGTFAYGVYKSVDGGMVGAGERQSRGSEYDLCAGTGL
jgi:hypothetical protein